MDNTEKKPRVLIIDDDASHRRLAQVIFERGGFEATIVSEGSEGVHLADVFRLGRDFLQFGDHLAPDAWPTP